MIVNRLDIYHFLNMRRSLKSIVHLACLTANFAVDRLTYSRGTEACDRQRDDCSAAEGCC